MTLTLHQQKSAQMGRHNTGAWTTKESLRIELSYLIKSGFVKKGCSVSGVLSWNTGSEIGIRTDLTSENMNIQLSYSTVDRHGKKTDTCYRIFLTAIPSNLGKGEVLYFLCPVSGKRCKVLYKAYGCDIWKSREAYQNRIYYPLQLSSQKSRFNDRYWQLESQLEKMSLLRKTSNYNGLPTRRALRMQGLQNAKERADEQRWSYYNLPVTIQKIINRFGVYH